jgi:hypothetical protein
LRGLQTKAAPDLHDRAPMLVETARYYFIVLRHEIHLQKLQPKRSGDYAPSLI